MDAPAPQTWGLGLRTKMKAPPPSFVIFFPVRDHPAFGTTAQQSAGKPRANISWSSGLVAPRPIWRFPAWHRVPVEAFSRKNGAESTRLIMKRICHLDNRFTIKKPTLQAVCSQVSAAKEAAQWTMVDRLELPDAKIRRLDTFKPSDALYQSFGAPQSAAEMAQILLMAKVDIVNGMLKIPRSLLKKEFQAMRSLKRTRGVAPMKRSIDKDYCIEKDGLYGGHRIETYDQLMPLIWRASEFGEYSIDALSASIAEISANFARSGRRNPRHRVSLEGVPTLPDIIDRPELKNEVSLKLPSGGSAADTKSPVKKSPQPIEPLKVTPRRLSDTVVKLVPAISPTIEASPVKSPATPSTPFVNTPSRVVLNETPSRLGHGAVSNPQVSPSEETPLVPPGPTQIFQPPSDEDGSSSSFCESMSLDTPSGLGQGVTANPPASPPNKTFSVSAGPTLTFQPPSYIDSSSSSLDQSMAGLSPCKAAESESPTKFPNPPEGASAMEGLVSAGSAVVADPQLENNASEGSPALGLVALVPAAVATPKQGLPSFRPDWPSDISQIDFGPITPSFESSNWLSNDITTRRKKTKSRTIRRKSEPLLSNHHKEQATRRQTLSPNHLVFRGDVVFDTPKASAPQVAELEQTSCQGEIKSRDAAVAARTPEQTASSDPNLNFVTPAISWGRMTGRVPVDGVTPLRKWTAPPTDIHNVDMRQHLDIFGAPAISTTCSSSAVGTLASIAKDHCDGQANVRVTEENGRLIVRFKLPTEFAHLFPSNQVQDESHFTVTPSAITSTPRINVDGHELTTASLNNGPTNKGQPNTPVVAHELDHTLVVSDLSTSPGARGPEDTTSSLLHQRHYPLVGNFGPVISPSQSKLATPLRQAEPDSAKETEARVPSRTPSPTLNLSFTPVNQSSPRSLSPDVAANNETFEVQIDQGLARQEQAVPDPEPYDDSPGRDYMRDFIKRTSRERLSTTEAGSPIAPPLKRMPLGAKSSNTPSPQKLKRKAEGGIQKLETDMKITPDPVLKKARLSNKLVSGEPSRSMESKEHANNGRTGAASMKGEATAHAANAAHDQEDEAGTHAGTRRSTRIRCQKPIPSATCKSLIPTAIKLGSRQGMVRGGLNSTTRTEQQDLSHQTRMNTRKNRGNAEMPSKVLAKYQEERVNDNSSESEPVGKPSTGGKNVGWKTPLEAHQEEKPKKMRTKSTYKSKASGIAKPSKPATNAQKQQRAAKAAATLGMSQNGTPAKAHRVTRSSTRVQRA